MITDEMIKLAGNNKVTAIGDDLILLYKTMPVVDEKLEEYFSNMRRAKQSGINIAIVLDYQLGDEKTSYGYSKGYFLEEKAKGTSIGEISAKHIEVDPIKNDIDEKVQEYLIHLKLYVDELAKRANASEEMYDKFIDDYVAMDSFGIIPDPKPFNIFFDENIGWTFIDVISYAEYMKPSREEEYLPSYIALNIYGYMLPQLFVNDNGYVFIPTEMAVSLMESVAKISKKLRDCFTKRGYSKKKIDKIIKENANKVLIPLSKNVVSSEEQELFLKKNNIR